MSAPLQLSLRALSQLDILELEEALEAGGLQDVASIDRMEEPVPSGSLGEPALVTLLISVMPQLVPALAAAIVLWVGRKRSGATTRARKISLTRNGLEITSFDQTSFDSSSSESVVQQLMKDALSKAAG